MLVPPVTLPPAPAALVQSQAVSNALPQVVTQAVEPISQAAVTPTPKSEPTQKVKERRQKERGERDPDEAAYQLKRGGHVNISV